MSDIVTTLIQCVTRAFYDTKQVIVTDAVLRYSALRDDHLASLLGLQVKELHKICGPLKEDRLLSSGSRADVRHWQDRRSVSRVYYYVDYQVAVDAIKWRMHKLVRSVEDKMRSDGVSKGYICPNCGQKYSSLDVNMLISADGSFFQCGECGSQLQSDEESAQFTDSKEKLGKLMDQSAKLVNALRAADDVVVPNNNFAIALANATLPNDDEYVSDYDLPTSKSASSLVSLPSQSLQIDFTSNQSEGLEKDLDAKRKAAMITQNAIPVWHSQSTISGELTYAGHQAKMIGETRQNGRAMPSVTSNDEKGDTERAIAEYYASLRQKHAQEASADEEEEEEDLEDVDVGSGEPLSTTKGVDTVTQQQGVKEEDNQDVSDEEDAEFEDV